MLSKSDFNKFLRCPCDLWLLKKRPDLVLPIDPKVQRVFAEGNVVDAWAQRLWPAAVNIDGFGKAAVNKTWAAIESGATELLQPTFMTTELMCRGDILVKAAGESWDIYEVKSSTEVKPEQIFDVAFQRLCMTAAGLTIGKTWVVHINNQYVRQGEIEPTGLFTIDDVSEQVAAAALEVEKEIARALEVLTWSEAPGLQQISACTNPDKCESLAQYFGEVNPAELSSLARELPVETLRALLERGLLQSGQVPAELLASLVNLDLPGAIVAPKISLDKPALKAELESLQYPLYFLDYETYFPAVPMFDGYWPYQHMVFQYSVHILRSPEAELEHVEYLAEGADDPAPKLVAALRADIGDAGSVIVWNASFEAARNMEMGRLLPEFSEFLANVNERMFDLMTIIRRGYYVDSRFKGRVSIKAVLPILCPELSYTDLAISEGRTASAGWPIIIDPKTDLVSKAQLKRDMLAYCNLDTLAMVEIFRKFSSVI